MCKGQLFRAISGVGLGITLLASAALAQPEDKRTIFTFNRPVTVPGATLAAGRYIFRIVDTTSSRKVIQVLSDDGKKPLAMMNTITDTRSEPAKDATVAFFETAKGTPSAVKSWWYPGERDGYEFIYPRTQARQIAKSTGATVLTTKSETTKTDETRTADLGRVDPDGRDQDVANRGSVASTEGARTPPQVSEPAKPAPSAAPQPVPTTSSRVARNELPRTASNLPLVALFSMIAMLGFATMRFGRSFRS